MREPMEEKSTTVINSIIGSGTEYNGNIDSIDLLRIDGNFSGTARSQDVILIGENGKVKGILIAPRIIIAGIFQGIIEQCHLVIVQSSAVILGGLNVQNVIIEPGAIISGSCHTYKKPESSIVKAEVEINTRIVGDYSSKTLEKLFSI